LKTKISSLIFGLLLVGNVTAAEYVADSHYTEVFNPQPVHTGEQIEVLEFFWYGCPHCYDLEPTIHDWLTNKPANADYLPMPAVLNKSWEFHARVYYTLEALGVLDTLHTPFFDSIHAQRMRINDLDAFISWATKNGIESKDAEAAFKSFAVHTKVQQARTLSENYRITGVPTLIVDGKYLTSASMAGGHDELMKVVNFLVAKSATERQQ